MKKFDYERIIVHDGIPHADDVLCCVFAKTLNPNIEIIRTRDEKILEEFKYDDKTIICDVGLGKFDHHQDEVPIDKNGRKHCAASLFFEEYGELLFNSEEKQQVFKEEILYKLMDYDNGISRNSEFSSLIQIQNGTWMDEANSDKSFEEQQKEHFKNMFSLANFIFSNIQKTLNLYEKIVEKQEKNYYDDIGTNLERFGYRYQPVVSSIADDYVFQDCLLQFVDFSSEIFYKYYSAFITACLLLADTWTDKITMCGYEDFLIDDALEDYEDYEDFFIDDTLEMYNDKITEAPKLFDNIQNFYDFMKDVASFEQNLQHSLSIAQDIVKNKAFESNKFLYLEQGMPFRQGIRDSGILFVIVKNSEGKYNVFPTKNSDNESCISFLDNIEQFKGCSFVHPSGFMATFESKEDAIEAVNKTIECYNFSSLENYLYCYARDVCGDNLYSDIFKTRKALFEYIKDSKCTKEEFINTCRTINQTFDASINKDIVLFVATEIINNDIISKITSEGLSARYVKDFNDTLIQDLKHAAYENGVPLEDALYHLDEFDEPYNESLDEKLKSTQERSEQFKSTLELVNKYIAETNPHKKQSLYKIILNEVKELPIEEIQDIIDCMENEQIDLNKIFTK